MKRLEWLSMLVILLVAVGACETTAESPPTQQGPAAAAPRMVGSDAATKKTAAIYAAVIHRLVSRDHTFGGGKSPFEHVYVVDGAVAMAGHVMKAGKLGAPFAHSAKGAIRRRLRSLPPIDFVRDPDSVRSGVGEVENNGVIITLGPIPSGRNKVEVENNLWCGGLCAQWLTYVLERQEEKWRITGTTGPYAIS